MQSFIALVCTILALLILKNHPRGWFLLLYGFSLRKRAYFLFGGEAYFEHCLICQRLVRQAVKK